ncbi:ABC transporter permease [Bacillus thermotolerans]|uniref:Hydroxymethylpyrimidine ABC transporter, transmembrane component n=1 Tax=Bacillus thermotolerans TaxID=1221996 RepID=A0A0F5I0U0_BACTR|nr:ABC transporter permease [Bacillus thermotolerans]KKB39123.1 Hydroxymethylpyrimidine ABC transporter, transmembrane component [Bacillus thermotolerans]KKB41590.1 Hydroxymethylpyrimidine ABC transporter, transmembrane component [Bacillus thermotolerans]KKB42743.1 Hydroxymethylpyrimidine ABC transporter, transmembrane component [Bacillus thermotolerans]
MSRTIWPPAFLLAAFLLGWEAMARSVNKMFILPSPTSIIRKLWELKNPLFLEHLPATLAIVVIGLLISIIVGIGTAVWMSLSPSVEKALYPLIISSQMIPIIALAPIFVLWFGYTIWSKVVVTVLITFFPITVNTFDGLKSGSRELNELMLTMGARKQDIFFKLLVPSALPHFFSGLKVAVTLSVIGAAIGEWLGAQAGLGYFSRRMMTQFDGAAVFAPIVLLSTIGILLFLIVKWLENRMLKWRKHK